MKSDIEKEEKANKEKENTITKKEPKKNSIYTGWQHTLSFACMCRIGGNWQ